MALFFALRKRSHHTELSLIRLHFNSDEEQISLELQLATYSHAPSLEAEARLKMDGIDYPMKLEPVQTPTNYQYAVLNTFQLRFVRQYVKPKTNPTKAFIDVKARFSDGSQARLRKQIVLDNGEKPSEPTLNKTIFKTD